MRYATRLSLIVLVVLALAAATGCKRNTNPLEGPSGSLAVAGFAQPRLASELLGGYIPDSPMTVKSKVLAALDLALAEELKKSGRRVAMGPHSVRQCSETVLAAEGGAVTAFEKWLAVGKCLDVDWLIVPQLTQWREREGSEVSVRVPASVTLSLHLLDVRNESFARRYRFEETQRPLTDNFLDTGKFIERGGKWITALELAQEGIATGLEEFGL